jgi:hypothetical protein
LRERRVVLPLYPSYEAQRLVILSPRAKDVDSGAHREEAKKPSEMILRSRKQTSGDAT